MVEKLPFGSSHLYRITKGAFQAEIIPQGAALRALRVPGRTGAPVDVVLGYDTPEEYLAQDGCLGGTVGRCANRIAGARFTLNARSYTLDANEPPNTLHGGRDGYHLRRWTLAPAGEDAVVCTLHSPDGDQGFPGALDIRLTYTLSQGVLTLDYQATAQADTVVNLTNHSYFNLDGHNAGCVGNHIVRVCADAFTPTGSDAIPSGAIQSVENTVLDLRQGAILRERLLHPHLARTQGFDHNYMLLGGAATAAEVYSARTGIRMDLRTDLPSLQLYTAGFLTQRPGKDGAVYKPRQGLCLESQYPPNAVNTPAFPSPVLAGGQTWQSRTQFAFSTLA